MTKPGPYKRRVPRSHRRVMLALLADVPGMSGYPVSRAAMVGFVKVYRVLNKLERAGWAEAWREGPDAAGRYLRLYQLTPEGRVGVLELLGLGPAAGEKMTG